MRMAYLIMAHDDRAGLENLLRVLLPPNSSDFAVVHADAGSPLWRDLRGGWGMASADPRVRLLPDPVKVIWGHWSQVEAARRLIDAALAEGCDYAHTLSGADWPVVSRERLIAEIAAEPAGTCFAEAVPGEQEDRMQDYRLDTRWLRLDPGRQRLAYAATWELRRAARIAGRIGQALGHERSRPLGRWSKGSCWWSLPLAALRTCSAASGELMRSGRLKGTVCADEHVVPTALVAKHAHQLQPNRRYIDFPPGASSPRILTAADLPRIQASGAWFARKVDANVDPFFRALPWRASSRIA